MEDFDKYKDFDRDQFLEDEWFRKWVFSPDGSSEAYWRKFLAMHPHQTEEVFHAREVLSGIRKHFERKPVSEPLIESHFKDTVARIGSRRMRRRLQIGSIAAAVLLLITFLYWFSLPPHTVVYTTQFGEWKTITLPDGSVVQLNANSSLSLNRDWKEGSDRRVHLKGEAFFSVRKKPESGAKFTVVTNDLELEVLGTAFNVHAREESTGVYLEEGEVTLHTHGKESELTRLKPGDYVAYSKTKQKIVQRHRIGEQDLDPDAWKDGSITFREEYAFQVLKKLEEIYGLETVIQDESIYERKFNMSVPLEDLETVIPILERTMGVTVMKKENKLVIE